MHSKYGDAVFELAHTRGNTQRMIVYSFKNTHFNIVRYYNEKCLNKTNLSSNEVRLIINHAAGHIRLIKWLDGYEEFPELNDFIKFEDFKNDVSVHLVMNYNYNMIDYFLSKFPDYHSRMLKQCSESSPSAKQLRRHLLLKEIIN